MKLQDILEELIVKFDVGKTYLAKTTLGRQQIAQAKSKIEEMFGEWVGEDKPLMKLSTNYRFGKSTQHGIRCYNQAKQEIRNRVKEVR